MTEYHVYGSYNEEDKDVETDSRIDFVVPLELMDHWQRCSMISNFLASTHAVGFDNTDKVSNLFSIIINELLENAVKFSRDRSKLIMLSLKQRKHDVCIEAINTTDEIQAHKLNTFIEKLETESPEDLYIHQLENIAVIDNPSVSGMGLIMLRHDYQAQLGIRIVPRIDDAHCYDVSISVALEKELIAAT
jgi:hypothetical protein